VMAVTKGKTVQSSAFRVVVLTLICVICVICGLTVLSLRQN
jgi:hypothetical protein